MLFIRAVFLQECESPQFGVGFGKPQHRGVARRDCLDLGVGQLLAADIPGAAGGVVAGDDLADETGLGIQGRHLEASNEPSVT